MNNIEYKKTMFSGSPNVFYLDNNVCLNELEKFIKLPFVEWDNEIKNYYSLEQWVERFN